jgi:hypothetical protein
MREAVAMVRSGMDDRPITSSSVEFKAATTGLCRATSLSLPAVCFRALMQMLRHLT